MTTEQKDKLLDLVRERGDKEDCNSEHFDEWNQIFWQVVGIETEDKKTVKIKKN
jgi:hypothetical protein